jgi:hypothetical protein
MGNPQLHSAHQTVIKAACILQYVSRSRVPSQRRRHTRPGRLDLKSSPSWCGFFLSFPRGDQSCFVLLVHCSIPLWREWVLFKFQTCVYITTNHSNVDMMGLLLRTVHDIFSSREAERQQNRLQTATLLIIQVHPHQLQLSTLSRRRFQGLLHTKPARSPWFFLSSFIYPSLMRAIITLFYSFNCSILV